MKYKAFTFFELLIVIFIIVIMYAFVQNTGLKDSSKDTIKLENLSSFLKNNYNYMNEIELVCLKNSMDCFIFLDNNITKENKISSLFTSIPTIYAYSEDLKEKVYSDITFNNGDKGSLFFSFKIDKDNKHDECIVLYEDRYYMFNTLYKQATVLEDINDIQNYFSKNIQKIKNVF